MAGNKNLDMYFSACDAIAIKKLERQII